MLSYGATTRNDAFQVSLQGRPVIVTEIDGVLCARFADEERGTRNVHRITETSDGRLVPIANTRTGRIIQNIHQHRESFNLLWCVILFVSLMVTLGPYYYEKNKNNPPICESDLSYPVAVFLSTFLGMFGIDRFYLGYPFVGLVKLLTAGGFGVLWFLDIVLILVGGLPDHNGCALVFPF